MATITELQERLALYKAAEKAILEGGQEYRAGSVRLTRADLGAIRQEIESIEHRLSVAQSSGRLSHSTAVFQGRR